MYQIQYLLGAGGMGAVFYATDVTLQREVALKLIHPRLLKRNDYLERFLREARAAARLNHPNIVQVYTAGQDSGIAYLALELVRGGSLVHLRKRIGRKFPIRLTAEIARDAARGLQAAHAHGIVHRDVKPDNILLAPGKVKLTDFGIAQVAHLNKDRATQSGAFLGTPRYSSPEQCVGDVKLDGRSDLYSLGVVCYTLLAGKTPHTATTPLMILRKIIDVEPTPIRELREDVPERFAEIIGRLLQKQRDDRYPDAAALAEALEGLLAELPQEGPTLDDVHLDVLSQLVASQPTQFASDVGTEELVRQILDEGRTFSSFIAPQMVALAADSITIPPTPSTARTPGGSLLPPRAQSVIDRLCLVERLALGGQPIAALRSLASISLELQGSEETREIVFAVEVPTDSIVDDEQPYHPFQAALELLIRVVGESSPRCGNVTTLIEAFEPMAANAQELRPGLEQLDALLRDPRAEEAARPLHVLALVELKRLGVGLALPWKWEELTGAGDDAVVRLDEDGKQQVHAAANVLRGLVPPGQQAALKAWNGGRQVVPIVSLGNVGVIQGSSAGLPTLLAMIAARLGLRPVTALAATGTLDVASIPSLPPVDRHTPAVYDEFLGVRVGRVESVALKLRAVLEQHPEVELCILPQANQADVDGDAELQERLDESGLGLRYVATVGDALTPELFDVPFQRAPLSLAGRAADVSLRAQLWLARVQAVAAVGLLLLTALWVLR